MVMRSGRGCRQTDDAARLMMFFKTVLILRMHVLHQSYSCECDDLISYISVIMLSFKY